MQRLDNGGQMAVEWAVTFPVALVLCAFALYASFYIVSCAHFNGVVQDAVRIEVNNALSVEETRKHIEERVLTDMQQFSMLDVSQAPIEVTAERVNVGHVSFEASITLNPACFALPLSRVFGHSVPGLTHTTKVIINPYRNMVVM